MVAEEIYAAARAAFEGADVHRDPDRADLAAGSRHLRSAIDAIAPLLLAQGRRDGCTCGHDKAKRDVMWAAIEEQARTENQLDRWMADGEPVEIGETTVTAPICDHDPWEGWDDDCAANHIDDLAGAIRGELRALWSDLVDARRSVINTDWSIQCENVAYRIVTLSRFVGALPWGHVSVTTLLDGTYGHVYDRAGIAYPQIDWDRVRAVAARRAR